MTNIMLAIWLVIIIFFLIWVGICIHRDSSSYVEMSFKESLDLVKLPVISFENNGKILHFMVDTGSSISILDESCIKGLLIKGYAESSNVINTAGGSVDTPCIVKVDISYKDKVYEEDFHICNLRKQFDQCFSEITLHGILGSCFFKKYGYDIDFEELKIYAK